ncbi:uncharacterized protein LOC125246244 [Megalobrama amblycephala]|uniref:uncharacterized protein LOC125246244 n=1 Tax=Megalobrama amblycephala TaxID=75352 RepID=UPI00201450EC|nr:uncharacterized protein LOC125246244 [Megalobrama amblycephala]
MAESAQNNGNGPALRPTTERHGTEPPNVTIDKMMENLNEYLDKRLGLRKCQGDICQKYNIRHSEDGQWALPDIKRAYGKMQRSRANTNRDGLSVILVKQIQQHLQKCETDKLLRENKAEKAKVQALAEQLQNEKKDKERLLNEKTKLLHLFSKRLELKDCSGKKSHSIRSSSKAEQEFLYPFSDLQKNEDQQDLYLLRESDNSSTVNFDSDVNTHDDIIKDNLKVRLAPVIVKNRRTEVEIDNEEEYEEKGE